MLQQTRVNAVLDYYKRFLRAFPTIKALAEADEQQVLAEWSGLGYYRRARMLHAAARELVSEGRAIPRTSAELQKLPGIGRYSAAAIASIAFGEPTAVVDGNVERVIRRLGGYNENDSLDVWASAQSIIDSKRPGDFNQAMMELGATACLPSNPECGACPVECWCETRGEHVVAKREIRRRARLDYVLAIKEKSLALIQRDKDARLMAGMWELPGVPPQSLSSIKQPILKLKHSITNTDYDVYVWPGQSPRGSHWVELKSIDAIALTGLTRKILRRMGLLAHLKTKPR